MVVDHSVRDCDVRRPRCGADLIRRCWPGTCSGGITTSEGTWQTGEERSSKVRGLWYLVVFVARTRMHMLVCGPGLTSRLGLLMARHVPSQAGDVTHDLFVTLLSFVPLALPLIKYCINRH